MNRRLPIAIAMAILLSGCAKSYSLVAAAPVSVTKAKIQVVPATAWNRAPRLGLEIPEEENWTANGSALDNISFIGGLNDGKAIVKQRKKADEKVPVFKAGMTPQDMVSMIESYYRIKAGATVFETTAVAPARFLGASGFQFDYDYVGEDEVKRQGRSVGAIVKGKFYLMTLDGAKLHYFGAALPEFERMVSSAKLG